jgi:hypothetical protein
VVECPATNRKVAGSIPVQTFSKLKKTYPSLYSSVVERLNSSQVAVSSTLTIGFALVAQLVERGAYTTMNVYKDTPKS